MESHSKILLDAGETKRRLLQQSVPFAAAMLLVPGLPLLALTHGAGRLLAGLGVAIGAALLGSCFAPTRLLVRWEVSYKGHRIRFQNHPLFGERLYLDDELVARGGLGIHKTLYGTLTRGEGAGERITAVSEAGLIEFRCRLLAESFAEHPGSRG